MDELNFNSVETVPNLNASAAFQVDSGKVFKEDVDMVPTIIDKSLSYMPWGGDNMMPYNILKLIEDDETLSTCQQFNAEVCYGSGLKYDTEACTATVKQQVEDFLLDNALPSYFLGVCQDFKHFAFCVSVIILNTEGTRIVRLLRKEACYCRLSPAVILLPCDWQLRASLVIDPLPSLALEPTQLNIIVRSANALSNNVFAVSLLDNLNAE